MMGYATATATATSPLAVLALAVVVALVSSPSVTEAETVDPAVRARAAASDGCTNCHAAEAAEWRDSLHRASHDDASYLVSLPGEPLAFCNGCHAPVATRASVGVDCVSCHGTPHDASTPARDAAMSCNACHEFDFPGHAGHPRAANGAPDPTHQMQRTVSEHAGSVEKDRACTACHMPRVGAHVSHRFGASRDAAMLRSAIDVAAHVSAPGVVAIDLRAVDPAHAFPTGDMFRRLVVHADAVDPSGAIVGSAERILSRHFSIAAREGDGPREIADDRVSASGATSTIELDLGERALGSAVRWRVDYERVTNGFRHPPEVRARVTLADGTVPASP